MTGRQSVTVSIHNPQIARVNCTPGDESGIDIVVTLANDNAISGPTLTFNDFAHLEAFATTLVSRTRRVMQLPRTHTDHSQCYAGTDDAGNLTEYHFDADTKGPGAR